MTSKVLVVFTLLLGLGLGADNTSIINNEDINVDIITNSKETSTAPGLIDSNITDSDPPSAPASKSNVLLVNSSDSSLLTESDEEAISILTNPPAPVTSRIVPLSALTLTSAASDVITETVKDSSEDNPTTSFILSTESSTLSRKTPAVNVKKLLPDRHTCGLQNERRRLEGARVASIGEFPWVALLRYRNGFGYDAGFRCTSTLISDKYLVTAAHCVVVGPEYLYLDSVRLGEWVVSTLVDCAFDYYREECSDRAIDVGIKKSIPHPQYDPTYEKNDIALIQMEKKVDYTGFIRPICLPVQNLSPPGAGTILTTSGWGTTRYGYYLDIKSKAQVSVWHKTDCLNRIWGYSPILDDQICIGKANPYDTCTPDSGGPLMALDKEDKPQWYLEGIMSNGFGCSQDNFFGVYTRISEHIGWILKTLAEESVKKR